jgi:hypothetical protein
VRFQRGVKEFSLRVAPSGKTLAFSWLFLGPLKERFLSVVAALGRDIAFLWVFERFSGLDLRVQKIAYIGSRTLTPMARTVLEVPERVNLNHFGDY